MGGGFKDVGWLRRWVALIGVGVRGEGFTVEDISVCIRVEELHARCVLARS